MNNDRFSNGFLLGLIIGGGAVFLFGTKTGKKLLKRLSEQGLEGLTEILEEVDLEDYEDEPMEKGQEGVLNHQLKEEEVKAPEEVKKPSKKRFFKRSSK